MDTSLTPDGLADNHTAVFQCSGVSERLYTSVKLSGGSRI